MLNYLVFCFVFKFFVFELYVLINFGGFEGYVKCDDLFLLLYLFELDLDVFVEVIVREFFNFV